MKSMASIMDRRFELTKSGQIQYVVVGYIIRLICEALSRLHICNAYLNILIILIIPDTGKIYAVKRVLTTRGILEFSWIEVFGKKCIVCDSS